MRSGNSTNREPGIPLPAARTRDRIRCSARRVKHLRAADQSDLRHRALEVKALQDRPSLLPVKDATVAYLVSRPAPSFLPDTRLPFEHRIFRVKARVMFVRAEEDGDFHVVLSDGKRTMITESPSLGCSQRAVAYRRRQMNRARARVKVCRRAVVTGVAFFDFLHGQTGVAPNGIELHPVLAFRCLS